MNSSQQVAIVGGASIGLLLSATLFFTVPAYHDLVVWSWTTPWVWALALAGGVIAYVTD